MCTYGNNDLRLGVLVWGFGFFVCLFVCLFFEPLVAFKLANGTVFVVLSKAILTMFESQERNDHLKERRSSPGNK